MASIDRLGDWIPEWLADGCNRIEGYAVLANRKGGKLLWTIPVEKKTTAHDLELAILEKYDPGGEYFIRAKKGDQSYCKRGNVLFKMAKDEEGAAKESQAKGRKARKPVKRPPAKATDLGMMVWRDVEALGEARRVMRDALKHSAEVSSEYLHITSKAIADRADLESEAAAAMAALKISEAAEKWGPDGWLFFLAGVAELLAPWNDAIRGAAASVRSKVDAWRDANEEAKDEDEGEGEDPKIIDA